MRHVTSGWARRAIAARVLIALAGLALGCLALLPALARAQGTARSMDLDPSVLSAGMGGASTAVWWNAEPNYWANPALLGYYRGIRWQWSHTQLVPGLPADVTFDTGRFTVGGAGIGYEMAGHPINGMGGLDVDYGTNPIYDAGGNFIGEFSSAERIEASGLGVSLSQLTASALALGGHDVPRVLRHLDVAGGYARKFTDVSLSPTVQAAATSHDWGVLAKGGFGGSYTGNSDAGPVSIEAGYAHSVLNYDDVTFDFGGGATSPPTRTRRDGVSARLAYDSYSGRNPAGSPMFSALMRGFAPIATLGFARDWSHHSAGGLPPEYEVDQWGIESTLINVVTFRFGHYRDVLGDIDDYTFGIGVALPLTEYAGARYDFATVPQAKDSGLPNVKRNSVSVWLNPIALRRALHPGS